MKYHLISTILSLLLLAACGEPTDHSATFLIRHVNVIDLSDGSIVKDQRVFIQDSLIVHIEADDQAPLATVEQQLEATGQYLIPGLWDMHVHLCWEPGLDSLFAKAFLHYGVTGVRDMGGSLELLNDYRRRIWKRPVHGPEVIGCGPFLDGNPPLQYGFSIAMDSSTDIRSTLDSLVATGSDFFKVYSMLPEAELERVAANAGRLGVPFAGHLSEWTEPETAIRLGQASVEHLNRLEELWPQDSLRLQAIAELMVETGSHLCPTAVIYHRKAWMDERDVITRSIDEGFIPPVLREEWKAGRRQRLADYPARADWDTLKTRFSEQLSLIGMLHDARVPILAGSDFAGMPYVYPGYGLHEELELLVEAGLSPLEALQSATLQPARFLQLDDRYGTVSEGKIADLVLLKQNPLLDIAHTLSIQEVIRAGHLVPLVE